jgi:NCAIR mutase (PurE)-related protein
MNKTIVSKIKRTPKRGTQVATILSHLQSGRSINQVSSAGLYGIPQLSGALRHLRQMGWNVVKKTHVGVRGSYAEYTLNTKGE